MKLLIIFIFVCYVNCDDGSYYVGEVSEENLSQKSLKPFNVYWNVPTMQCTSKNVPFTNLYEDFGIIQNKNDRFRGENITILYDPGMFPAIFKSKSGKIRFRNGGIPQEGNLDLHLEQFRSDINTLVPDPDFSGVGVIDFESWRPVFRQHWGSLAIYINVSIEMERKLHPGWTNSSIQAKHRFEHYASKFMLRTLSLAKEMRPKAVWGYYGFPHCFNYNSISKTETCSNQVQNENSQISWLWEESTALFPSVYRSHDLSSSDLSSLIRGRVQEAARVRTNGSLILPYFWFRYRDGGFLTEEDLEAALNTMYESDAFGLIIWGSSDDVNTINKCNELLNYVQNVLGPAIAKYTKNNTNFEDYSLVTENNDYTVPTVKAVNDAEINMDDESYDFDPDIDWKQQ